MLDFLGLTEQHASRKPKNGSRQAQSEVRGRSLALNLRQCVLSELPIKGDPTGNPTGNIVNVNVSLKFAAWMTFPHSLSSFLSRLNSAI
jgi:hypothetical protein